MFDADRPITAKKQDLLNRSQFASYLARCMLDHKEPESLVVGLQGGWGVGKTSMINLVMEELNFAATNLEDCGKPILLNFNAWSYSGQNQLIYSFFRRLSSALRSVTYLENAERIIHLLELYVSFFTHQPVPKALRTKRSWYEKLTRQGQEEVYAWESGRDLTLVKSELNELLSQQSHKIIIMIDNISRLYDHEIKQIFQIVKSMGDYANTIYLLSYDKTIVVQALNKIDDGNGEDFLEKIIQLPFVIPPIVQQDLEKVLADRLSEVLEWVPEGTWDTEYWADIYYNSLKLFFENSRDITRYVNLLGFSYARLRDTVNPVDFFALTAIEVFMPAIYAGIRENKDLFTDLLDNVYVLDKEEISKDKIRCDEILAREKKLPREILLTLLMQLFPRIRHLYQPDLAFYHSDVIARDLRRICSPDLFDAYFRLSMQAPVLPISEFETILALSHDKNAFDQALTRLNQDNRILQFLDQLDSFQFSSVAHEQIQAIVSALLDNGDLFPQGIVGPLCLDTPLRIHRIIHALLQRIDRTEERFIILQNAIAHATKSIYILISELQHQALEHLHESDTFMPLEFRDLNPEQLESLQKLAASRIAMWAQNDSLVDHPRLLSILIAWRNWGGSDACQQFVRKITQTDRGLIAFLTAVFDKSITEAMVLYEKNHTWEIDLTVSNSLIPHTEIVSHAVNLFENNYFEKLREREQLALMIFLDLTKAKTKKVIPQTV